MKKQRMEEESEFVYEEDNKSLEACDSASSNLKKEYVEEDEAKEY